MVPTITAVRARPILLTAAAVVFGEAVLLLDPVMRGLGLTLMSGAVAGTVLTLVVVPVAYYDLRTALAARDARRAARGDHRLTQVPEWNNLPTVPID
jgi:hypothetical protein